MFHWSDIVQGSKDHRPDDGSSKLRQHPRIQSTSPHELQNSCWYSFLVTIRAAA